MNAFHKLAVVFAAVVAIGGSLITPASAAPVRNLPTFVHDGEIAYVKPLRQVYAYGGTVYADREASVHAFDYAIVYYYPGAEIHVDPESHVKTFRCTGRGWTRCVRTR